MSTSNTIDFGNIANVQYVLPNTAIANIISKEDGDVVTNEEWNTVLNTIITALDNNTSALQTVINKLLEYNPQLTDDTELQGILSDASNLCDIFKITSTTNGVTTTRYLKPTDFLINNSQMSGDLITFGTGDTATTYSASSHSGVLRIEYDEKHSCTNVFTPEVLNGYGTTTPTAQGYVCCKIYKEGDTVHFYVDVPVSCVTGEVNYANGVAIVLPSEGSSGLITNISFKPKEDYINVCDAVATFYNNYVDSDVVTTASKKKQTSTHKVTCDVSVFNRISNTSFPFLSLSFPSVIAQAKLNAESTSDLTKAFKRVCITGSYKTDSYGIPANTYTGTTGGMTILPSDSLNNY